MKITFILPAIGKKSGEKYIGTWKMEPLTIAVLKSLTPKEIQTEFFDDRIELIDYDSPTDIVLITVETYTALRAYQIADKYRKRHIPVVMGGYHVTLSPQEALEYADSIMTGNAESIYQQMLYDFSQNKLQKHYYGHLAYTHVLPDKSIFGSKKYLPISLVETGRGCNHHCEFCAISSYYCRQYYPRPIEDIVADIKQSKHKYHFLVDDNLVANRDHALKLFQAIKPLHIKWAGQGTLSIALDKELLKAMKESGCEIILIGFESLEENNLKQMQKSVNLLEKNRDELVEEIHRAGIGIYATFVFGYDSDTEQTVYRALQFAEKHRFYTCAFNHLLPFPGTALYERLEKEKKLLYPKWWLKENYSYGQLAFQPEKVSPEALSKACQDARKRFSNFQNTLFRGFQAMKRESPLLWALFWVMNLNIGSEVDQKMNIPLGRNLDELPK